MLHSLDMHAAYNSPTVPSVFLPVSPVRLIFLSALMLIAHLWHMQDLFLHIYLGYDVTPLDASEEMCKLAEIHTDLDVLQMNFEDMEFEDVFDGIWACGSLIHIPKNEMPEILGRIHDALCNDGILYISVKKGDTEGFRGERYFCDYTAESLTAMLEKTGLFEILEVWETDDVRSSHPDTVWVNLLARKR